MSNSFLKKKYIQDLILKDCDDYTIDAPSNRIENEISLINTIFRNITLYTSNNLGKLEGIVKYRLGKLQNRNVFDLKENNCVDTKFNINDLTRLEKNIYDEIILIGYLFT